MPNKTYTLEEREDQIKNFMEQMDHWRTTVCDVKDVVEGPIIYIPLSDEQETILRGTKHAVEGMRTIFREVFGYQ